MEKTWALAFPALAGPVYTMWLGDGKWLDDRSECRGFGWPFTLEKNKATGFRQGTEIAIDQFVEHVMAMK